MKADRTNSEKPERVKPSSPYGPHPGHVDDASGGADSSPFDNMSSDERQRRLDASRRGVARRDDSDEEETSRH